MYLQKLSFIIIFVLVIKRALSSSHHYKIPTLVQQNNIFVPITFGGYDPCRFFQINQSTLYRMGQSNIISSWNLNSLNYTQQNMYQTSNWALNVSNIGIGKKNNQMIVTLKSPFATKKIDFLNSNTLQKTTNFINTTNASYTVIKIQSTSTEYLQLLYSNSSSNYLIIYDKSWNFINQINLNFTGLMNSTLSNDQTALAVWNVQGIVRYILKQSSSWIYYAYYNPYNYTQSMNSIEISKNGTFVILQYDSLSPLTVVNFKNINVVSSKNFSHTIINKAIFLDKDCHLIALTVNYTTLQIYDTLTLNLKSSINLAPISNYSAIDYNLGKLYFCLQQNIKTYKIQCPSLTYRNSNTNECITCHLSSNCISCNSQTGLCNSCDSNYTLNINSFLCQSSVMYFQNISNLTNTTNQLNQTDTTNRTNSTYSTNLTFSYNSSIIDNFTFSNNITNYTSHQNTRFAIFSSTQGQTINATLKGFQVINPIIKTLFGLIQMSPFALIFISFMNYWNLCCLYSILNFNVPFYLPQVHKEILDSIQISIFSQLGFNLSTPVLNTYNVSSTYFQIDYQISLDAINPNLQNVLMIIFVLSLILIVIFLRVFIINRSFFLQKYLKFNIIQVFLGQFISFVPFCILPYRFLATQVSSIKFSQKINNILQVFILILCLSAPSIFIWSRSKTYHKIANNNQQNQQKSKPIITQKIINLRNKKRKIQNLKQLLMFVTNISVPLLIILPVYIPFFMMNLAIFLYGIKIAAKSTKYKVNNIITACYLPLYHSCYILLYIFGQYDFIYHYVGLFCLIILFIGGVHELCNVLIITLIEFIKWLVKILKQNCKSSKVQNQQLHLKQLKNGQNSIQSSNLSIKNNMIQNKESQNNNGNKIKIHKSFKKIRIKGQITQNTSQNIKKKQAQAQNTLIMNAKKIKSIKFKIQKTYKNILIVDQNHKKPLNNTNNQNIDKIKQIQQNSSNIKEEKSFKTDKHIIQQFQNNYQKSFNNNQDNNFKHNDLTLKQTQNYPKKVIHSRGNKLNRTIF